MIEGQLQAIERGARGAEVLPQGGARRGRAECGELRLGLDIGNHHHPRDAVELREHRGHQLERIRFLAGVEIAVGREQYLGRDLPEALEHAVHAEIRRARGPHRPEAGGGEHRDRSFRHVGHEAGHAVAGHHARRRQARGDARHFAAQLAVGERAARAALVAEHQCWSVVVVAQQVRGEVQPRRREEARAGHQLRVLEHRTLAPGGADVGEACELAPEILRRVQRPRVQLLVGRKLRAVAGIYVAHEAGEVRIGDARSRRTPQFAHDATATGSSVPSRPRAWSR